MNEENTSIAASNLPLQAPVQFDKSAFEAMPAEQMLAHVADTADDIVCKYFQLGAMLSSVSNSGAYKAGNHDTFADYVSVELGFRARKAHYLINIWESLSGAGIEASEVAQIGWTKAREIAPVIDADNKSIVLGKASRLTVAELKSERKADTLGKNITSMSFSVQDQEDEAPAPAAEVVHRHTLVMHPEQELVMQAAVADVQKRTGSDALNDTIAHICTFYLAQVS